MPSDVVVVVERNDQNALHIRTGSSASSASPAQAGEVTGQLVGRVVSLPQALEKAAMVS
jgi:hypothetical protein